MKLKTLSITTLTFASWSMVAFAQSGATGPASATNASPSASVSASSSLSQSDKNFVITAAHAGLSEVAEGKLAEQKGDKAVQAVGQRMVTDHTKANDELASIAQNLGITLPTAPNAVQQAQYSSLQNLSGSTFDRDYLADQHKAHVKAIALFQREANSGQSPALKNFASQTLPILRDHLQMIEAAQKSSSSS